MEGIPISSGVKVVEGVDEDASASRVMLLISPSLMSLVWIDDGRDLSVASHPISIFQVTPIIFSFISHVMFEEL